MSQLGPSATSPFLKYEWEDLSWRKEPTNFQVKLKRTINVPVAPGFEIEVTLHFPAFLDDKSY